MCAGAPAGAIREERSTVPLSIKLFGNTQIEIGGTPLPRLRSRSELWLLALLVLQNGRSATRSWLAQSLWPFPDHSVDLAAYNLRRALSNLRKALGSEAWRLESVASGSVRLNLEGCSVDVTEFEAAMAVGDLPSLARAIALYDGPLLLQCTEPWAAVERARLHQRCRQALEFLAESASSAGDHGTAAVYLRRALAADPLSEPQVRSLMQTLARAGDAAGAVATYHDFSRALHRERNAFPDSQTTALFYEIRVKIQDRTAPTTGPPEQPSRPAPLPAPVTALIGRGSEIKEIRSLLASSRLVTLTGAGGIGKTRLAISVAEETGDSFPDGVSFIDLSAITEGGEVAQAVCAALEIGEAGNHTLTQLLLRQLAARRTLILLDNCEQVAGAVGALTSEILHACREVRILATSRQTLGAAGECVWRVAPLALPDAEAIAGGAHPSLDLLQGYAAVQLFVERARQADPRFQLTTGNAQAVASICAQLDGIPLALELAAARLRAMSAEQMSERLHDRFRLLDRGQHTANRRQQTLEAAIKWSFELLDGSDRNLLEALTVFAGGWTLEMAETVGEEIGIPAEEVSDALVRFVDRSLIVYDSERRPRNPQPGRSDAATPRYRFLETIRQYSLERWMGPDAVQQAALRQLALMLQFANEAEPHLQAVDQSRWFAKLQEEHDNLRAALDWSLSTDAYTDSALCLAGSLWRYWQRRGQLQAGSQYLGLALARTAGSGATRARAIALIGAGMLEFARGDMASARRVVLEGRDMADAVQDAALRATALQALGQMAWDQGRYDEARRLFSELLKTYRLQQDSERIGATLNYLGIIASDAGEFAEARACFEEHLALGKELNDRRQVANALHGLGHMAFYQSDFIAARGWYAEELSLARGLRDRERIARTLHRLGSVEQALENRHGARSLFEESLLEAEELGYRDLESAALQSLGATACAQRDFAAARYFWQRRLTLCRDRGDGRGISYSLDGIAEMLCSMERPREALTLFAAGQQIRRDLGFASTINRAAAPRIEAARALMDANEFTAAWALGESLSAVDAMTYAGSLLEAAGPRSRERD